MTTFFFSSLFKKFLQDFPVFLDVYLSWSLVFFSYINFECEQFYINVPSYDKEKHDRRRSPRIRSIQIFFETCVSSQALDSQHVHSETFAYLQHSHTQTNKHSCGGYEKLSRRGKCPRSCWRIDLEIRNSESKKERDRCVLRESWKESEIDFVPLFLLLISNKR